MRCSQRWEVFTKNLTEASPDSRRSEVDDWLASLICLLAVCCFIWACVGVPAAAGLAG
jgi:hypothetical protein